jgi:hypothetical protein
MECSALLSRLDAEVAPPWKRSRLMSGSEVSSPFITVDVSCFANCETRNFKFFVGYPTGTFFDAIA